jgi:hypothetical protein
MRISLYEIVQLVAYLAVAGVFLYLAVTDGGTHRWVIGSCGAVGFIATVLRIATRKTTA